MSEEVIMQAPSVNIMLTNVCTNRCKYCFAPVARDSSAVKASYISVDDLRSVLAFLKRSRVRSVRLLGGEPLLHPDLGLILAEIASDDAFDHVSIFTGGVFEPDKIECLANDKISLVVNTNLPKDYASKSYRQLISNLETMADTGVKFALGFNIYEEDGHWSPLVTLGAELGVDTLRICIACPTVAGDTLFLGLEQQRKLGPHLYSLIAQCAEKQIDVLFDCVVPPCIFTDAQWGSICRMFPKIEHGASVCSPCLDIDPDLRVYRCFAIREPSVALDAFDNTAELNDFFCNQVDAFKWYATRTECSDCTHRLARICQGGCIAFYWPQITALREGLNRTRAIFDRAYASLRSKEYDSAVKSFELGLESSAIDVNIISDYIYALLKCAHIDKAEEALKSYQRVLQVDGSGASFLLRGLICEARQEYRLAKAHYRRALRQIDHKKRAELLIRLAALSEESVRAEGTTDALRE